MIAWREAMSVGSPALDADHKRLIELVNLTEEWGSRDSWPQVGAVIDDLMVYVREHFQREEAVMAAIRFPELEAHRKRHEALAARARLLNDKFRAAANDGERKTCCLVLTKVLNEWLLDHILKQDMKFKPLIPKKPQPAAHHAPELQVGLPQQTEAELAAERKARKEARDKDVEYELPPNLAHLLKRIEYVVPEMPPPEKEFDSFEKLCAAAVCRRVDKVLIFFQRHNPALNLELPPFFLASAEFADKFRQAIGKFIFPMIWESRQVRMLATNFDWAAQDAESFWEHINRQLEQSILQGWTQGWDELRLIEVKKDGQKVLQVKDNTKALREMLQPSSPSAYDLPRIGNREIDVFQSLLDPANDWWETLNRAWRICHDLYEQEKEPRIFQQKAREGAFRDGLLSAFNRFPPEWVDFLVLACHRVFPRVSTSFLEGFATNLGRNEAEREAHIPYTIRYLRQARTNPDIFDRERLEEQEWQAQMKELSDYLAHREPKA
ncbi:MAG: bacteriohemerythrin [Phaeospirillum sp.]|nr:bacteriohemerythrin [Phaeospirillum sp.]